MDGLLEIIAVVTVAMEEGLRSFLAASVVLVEACGAVVILAGVARTMYHYVHCFWGKRSLHTSRLRMELGQSMVMGLEFQVAADILKTALSPQWNDVLLLGALIGLRTVLNYLMEREIEHLNLEWIPGVVPEIPKQKKKL